MKAENKEEFAEMVFDRITKALKLASTTAMEQHDEQGYERAKAYQSFLCWLHMNKIDIFSDGKTALDKMMEDEMD
jgi:hypothetical protein